MKTKTPEPLKTKPAELHKAVTAAVESLLADADSPAFTPQLAVALGGLRAAQDALAAHLTLTPPPAP